ncbi:MAG: hypothetical protein ACD_16C00190G0017 [uncultured bacterium]|nr:MAG: hypothetical protein ACD_16C00190G0017 [uncultured bacterium]OFW69181.1 MAG: hypothetical protein A2X70_02805 [Alphaproteobacteria bacterium GWC2_42_16]OFW73865.1 MAG: hypothetical protein A2Z80_03365 [Alphaproteobacteria bacterium GWA2_41_27]OFW82721.1 MAG: hypothetical protein A3E50_01060 [Alphaproteobacteria bacterium RIFCSPHIGHO2_12_FULL_42_100]OFW86540.1 MAG: hypothetical protein A2W06_07445 [Alphaproteobacteria bacterium RBG_16_42_14]OFW91875.1 MAG: hypothetical protein A3C41_038
MKRLLFFAFFSVFSTASFAKPLVVTTFSILQDMVHVIGQDKIEIRNLVGPNQDVHVFEPRPENAKDLTQANLVINNGLGFEGWLDRLIKASGFQGQIAVASKGVRPIIYGSRRRRIVDPHAWHSLENAQIYVDNIVEALTTLLPKETSFFKAQAKAYKKSLKILQKKIYKNLKDIPPEMRTVISNHNAFDYLGQDYNIKFYAPLGISTDSEPSAKVIAKLIERIRKEKIRALFVENISNRRLLEQISKETGVKIAGVLYSDALSEPGTEADTYLKMMTFNLSSLVKALKE